MTSAFLVSPTAVATAGWAPALPVQSLGSACDRLSLVQGLAVGPPGSPGAVWARGRCLGASPGVRTEG